MVLREPFGSTIGRLRFAADLSQEKLGELSEVHPTTISKVERGKANITLDTMEALALALRIDPGELLRLTADAKAKADQLRAVRSESRQIRYAIVAERTASGYSAYCPDLPSCSATAASAEELVTVMQRAVAREVRSLRRGGKAVPEPATYTYLITVTL
jgi:transcriptional regulator with XRE-family HTH domain